MNVLSVFKFKICCTDSYACEVCCGLKNFWHLHSDETIDFIYTFCCTFTICVHSAAMIEPCYHSIIVSYNIPCLLWIMHVTTLNLHYYQTFKVRMITCRIFQFQYLEVDRLYLLSFGLAAHCLSLDNVRMHCYCK